MWPEHEGDDRWWIHPLEERVHGDETFADATRSPTPDDSAMTDVTSPPLERTTVTTRRGIDLRGARRCARVGSGRRVGRELPRRRRASSATSRCSARWLSRLPRCYAPIWPGYSEQPGEEKLEDMLDFALHGADIVEALGLHKPHLIGHSMGGMVAAEMAAARAGRLRRGSC